METMTLPALMVQDPWITLIERGDKDIELRTWVWKHRGDTVFAAQADYLGGRFGHAGWRVAAIEPGRGLYLDKWGAFVLRPIDSNTTRLIIRSRGAGTPTLAMVALSPLNVFVFEPAHLIMQRAMMRGIRDRSEAAPARRLSVRSD